ncbi:MAG TPA: SRPBCC family protein [Aggregatilineales bacterium]|nr:polyketide cyclase [Anaerolineales bacterium]HRE48030.1 SRPBCC family protein [Aggregatilineales bacterium]
MPTNDYHFITHWRMEAALEEITAILREAKDLPRWWSSVYLAVKELAPGDADGIGKRIDLYTKGWLPYTLRWTFTVTEAHPLGFSLTAEGDFVGRGVWTFKPDGNFVDITYDWHIRAEKPLLKRLSFLLKPIFKMNHLWAMARGEESLRLELRRVRAKTSAEREAVPPPPPPTPNNPFSWLVAVLFQRKRFSL